MSDKTKAALTIAAVTAAAVLILALIAGIGSLAAHTGFLHLLQRVFSAAGGAALLLAAFRFLTHRTAPDGTKKDTGKRPLPITAGLLSLGVVLVLLAGLIDYSGA